MRLVAYANPVGKYPAVAIPIFADATGNLYGAFATVSGQHRALELQPVLREGTEQLPQSWDDKSIADYRPTEIGVIALSPQNIIAYPFDREVEIVTALLGDPSFAAERPFTRLAFARRTGSVHLIATELLSASISLLTKELATEKNARARIESWLECERARLAEQFEIDPDGKRFLAEFPCSVADLGSLAWWRGHVSVVPPSRPVTLLEIEDRKPSPKMTAVLTKEPVVPDSPILGVMGRHIYSGTNYVFFHDPAASPVALQGLRDATRSAVEAARRTATGPLSKLTQPVVGDVKFFKLAEQWTGSPYVFYEEATERGAAVVVGYRGLEVGAAIAHSYERLPNHIAFELLEALTSGAPKPELFEAQHPAPEVFEFEPHLARRRALSN